MVADRDSGAHINVPPQQDGQHLRSLPGGVRRRGLTQREFILGGLSLLVAATGAYALAENWDKLFPQESPISKAYKANEPVVNAAYSFLGNGYEVQAPLLDHWAAYQQGVANTTRAIYNANPNTDRSHAFRQLYTAAVQEGHRSDGISNGLAPEMNQLLAVTEAYLGTSGFPIAQPQEPHSVAIAGVDTFMRTMAGVRDPNGSEAANTAQQGAVNTLIGTLPDHVQVTARQSGSWVGALNTAFQYAATAV